MTLPRRPLNQLLDQVVQGSETVRQLCRMATEPTGSFSDEVVSISFAGISGPVPVSCRITDPDAEAFYETFVLNDLPPEWRAVASNWRSVVDLGAHVGFFSALVERSAPNAHFYLVEAVKANAHLCLMNAAGRGKQWQVRHAAAGGRDGRTQLWQSGWWTSGSIVEQVGAVRQADARRFEYHHMLPPDEVEVRTLGSLLRDFCLTRVDLLKVDIEGAELEMMESAAPVLSLVDRIAIEIHDKYIDGDRVRSLLAQSGFSFAGRSHSLEFFERSQP